MSGRPSSRRTVAASLLAGAVLLTACSQTDTPADADPRPDLILVVVDTLRADRTSVHGYERPTTPGLEAIAADGVAFDDAVAQSSWTLPSMASMLSGRHVFVNAQTLPPVPSLAERLRDAGYETHAFVGNAAINARGAFDRGFDTFMTRDDTGGKTWAAADLEAAVDGWLSEAPPGRAPRFYYLHYLDPHWPYEPPEQVTLPGQARLTDDTIEAWMEARREGGEGSPIWSTFDADQRYVLEQFDRYDREIAATDASIMRVVDRILSTRDPAPGMPGHGNSGADHAARTSLDDHLLVIASDHGEVLWDHPHHPKKLDEVPADEHTLRNVFFRDHSYHMYQSLVNTPLVVRGAGFPRGVRHGAPVENVDIAPTLLRAAGLPDDPSLDGRALQDVVTGTARPRPVLFAHANEATMVRTPRADGDWKLIWPTDTGFDFGMQIQLYDLSRDGTERHNLREQRTDIYAELLHERERASEAFDLVSRDGTGALTWSDGSPITGGSPQRELLQALGYLDTTPEDGQSGNAGAAEPMPGNGHDPSEPDEPGGTGGH